MSAGGGISSESRHSPRLLAALAAFSALLVTLASRHEMWRDEVRAFSVATQSPSWTDMIASLHQEGHPAIWYVLLRAGYAVTHSNLVLPGIAIAVAVAAAYMILRHAPFPFWLRLSAVFGAFLGYELSVVARNYGIGLLFMVGACVAFPHRARRPWILAACLALMANTSVHAAIASVVLLFLWLSDFADPNRRAGLTRPAGIAAVSLVVAGVATALLTASPTPDMAWAFSAGQLDAGRVLRDVFADPGHSLRGTQIANVAAAGEFPWRYTGIDPAIASRIIVDACLAWLAWSLRRQPFHLAAFLLAIVVYSVLFREVYSGALRHQGMVAFLFLAIAWLAVERTSPDPASHRRSIALGLAPLFLVQSLALPFVAQRYFNKAESGSKAYGRLLSSLPDYRDAILMSEPDYLMESMPYYVDNRVYMPRQNEFHYRVYFDRGRRRLQDLSLTRLLHVADSVGCAHRAPVLLALGYTGIAWQKSGIGRPVYEGAIFRWNEAEWRVLQQRAVPFASYPYATTDEIYHVVELNPAESGRCFR